MSTFTFESLDLSNENDLTELETKLYKAFVENIPNKWIQSKYKKIGNNRLRPNIPYSDQVISIMRNEKDITGAISVTLDINKKLELEDFGFQVEKNNHICESVFFFTDGLTALNFLHINDLFVHILQYLKEKDIHYWYGTCDDKLFMMYRYFGCELLEQTIYDGDTIDLFRLSIS